MFNALSEFSYVVNMISLIPFLAWFFRPSNTNQIGTICGLPSFLTVASFTVKVSCIRNFSISFLDISVIIAIMSTFLKSNFNQRTFATLSTSQKLPFPSTLKSLYDTSTLTEPKQYNVLISYNSNSYLEHQIRLC